MQKQKETKKKKKFGRNPKSDRDWKDRKKIEISKKDRKIEKVQIEKGNKSPNRKGNKSPKTK